MNSRTRELTVRAVIIGILLSVSLGAANVYLGLYAGMTVSASIPAAVISMAILRTLLRGGTVKENNIVQSMASAGESLAAGVIFTLPALLLSGVWVEFNYWAVTLIALSGGIMGVVFMVPLRSALIEARDDLPYPEGVACAGVLNAGESGRVSHLIYGVLAGSFIKFLTGGIKLIPARLETFFSMRGIFQAGIDLSPALIGVGYLVRFNIAVQIFLGGSIAFLVVLPLISLDHSATDIASLASSLWSSKIRYIGVGAMAVGGVLSLIEVSGAVMAVLKNLISRKKTAAAPGRIKTERKDLPLPALALLLVFISILTAGLYFYFLNSLLPALLFTFVMLLTGFIFTGVAVYIVGLVGSSNSPVSGMTISVLLLTGVMVLFTGLKAEAAVLALLGVSGVVCSAVCTAGDIAQDLKTGQLVKASPEKQQISEIIGILAAAFVMAPVLQLLSDSYGIGTGEPGSLAAPQATLFAGLASGLAGSAELPFNYIFTGAMLALMIYLFDKMSIKLFRLHVMPIAVGIYLPISLSSAILLGGIIDFMLRNSEKFNRARTTLTASGLIAGEAITGIVIALTVTLL